METGGFTLFWAVLGCDAPGLWSPPMLRVLTEQHRGLHPTLKRHILGRMSGGQREREGGGRENGRDKLTLTEKMDRVPRVSFWTVWKLQWY